MDRKYLYENLLEWIRLFSFVTVDVDISSLLDGEIISEILFKIEPSYFTEEWKSKLSFDSESNWRLKASNMKKIISAMSDFLMVRLNLSLENFQFPDSTIMCENRDHTEMSRLLQLLLLCAVNCYQKETYIQKIMSMESSKQLVIMKAIQEFMSTESAMEVSIESEQKAIGKSDEIDSLKREKENLRQKCHDLEFKMSLIIDEKSVLEAEVKRLNKQSQGDSKLSNLKSMHDDSNGNSPESIKIRQLQERLCSLKSELFQLEHNKDDSNQRLEELEKENVELIEKVDRLNDQISEHRYIKDELDITKEKLKTLTGIEATLEKYKKHIDDSGEMVRQNRQLELENSNYLDRIFKLEEELKKTVSWKNQIEMYKNEISEIQSQCSQKEKDYNKSEFELKRISEKLKVMEHDKMTLQEEVKKLRDENDDLHLNSYTLGSESSSDPNSENHENNSIDDSIDFLEIPISMREKVIRLQKEVKELRRSAGAELLKSSDINSQSREQLIVSLEASQSRLKQLTGENKQLHHENLILNAKLEDQASVSDCKEVRNTEKEYDSEKMPLTIEQTETKYKGYLEKAKYVIYHLHQKLLQYETYHNNTESQEIATPPTPTGEHDASFAIVDNKDHFTRADYEALKESFIAKERQLDDLQKQYESFQCLREEEEKMVVAAWYNLGVRLNREAAQERLHQDSLDHSMLMNSTEPNSFLAKQRMAHLLSSSKASKDGSTERHS